MSNIEDIKTKATEIILDGKVHHLKYDMNAFAELEELYGSLSKALNSLGGETEKDDQGKEITIYDEKERKDIPVRKISIKALRAIFWAGLLHENHKLTLLEAGEMLSLTDMKYLAEKLTEAIQKSMPKTDEEEETPTTPTTTNQGVPPKSQPIKVIPKNPETQVLQQ